MLFKNYMEDAVEATLDEILEWKDTCRCERCRSDVKALALNHLPPKYVVPTRAYVTPRSTTAASSARHHRGGHNA